MWLQAAGGTPAEAEISFTVLLGCHTRKALEACDKVAVRTEREIVADIYRAEFGVFQHILGCLYASFHYEPGYRGACFLPEKP